jgi:hypothetical protein
LHASYCQQPRLLCTYALCVGGGRLLLGLAGSLDWVWDGTADPYRSYSSYSPDTGQALTPGEARARYDVDAVLLGNWHVRKFARMTLRCHSLGRRCPPVACAFSRGEPAGPFLLRGYRPGFLTCASTGQAFMPSQFAWSVASEAVVQKNGKSGCTLSEHRGQHTS